MDDLSIARVSAYLLVASVPGQWCLNELVAADLTSELRLLVSVPGASCRSSRIVEVPSREASCRATASPTTPAPMTLCESVERSCVREPCGF